MEFYYDYLIAIKELLYSCASQIINNESAHHEPSEAMIDGHEGKELDSRADLLKIKIFVAIIVL